MADAGVPVLVEIKVALDIWRWPPALGLALKGYAGPLGVMSFDPRISRLVKTNLPEIRRGLVVRASLPQLRRKTTMWLAPPQFLAVDRCSLRSSWEARGRRQNPVYSRTIRPAPARTQAAGQ